MRAIMIIITIIHMRPCRCRGGRRWAGGPGQGFAKDVTWYNAVVRAISYMINDRLSMQINRITPRKVIILLASGQEGHRGRAESRQCGSAAEP